MSRYSMFWYSMFCYSMFCYSMSHYSMSRYSMFWYSMFCYSMFCFSMFFIVLDYIDVIYVTCCLIDLLNFFGCQIPERVLQPVVWCLIAFCVSIIISLIQYFGSFSIAQFNPKFKVSSFSLVNFSCVKFISCGWNTCFFIFPLADLLIY